MKAIYLVSDSKPATSGQHALALARGLTAAGHSVVAVLKKGNSMSGEFRNAGADVATAPLGGSFDIVSPVKLSKILQKSPEERTVVHTFRMTDAVTAARARALASRPDVRIIVTRLSTKPAAKGAHSTALYNEIDAVHFPLDHIKTRFLSSNPDIDNAKLLVIPTAVNIPASHSDAVGVPDSERLELLTAGDIVPGKGLDTIIEALGMLGNVNFRLTVLGTGQGPVVMPAIRRSRLLGIADRIDWRGEYGDLYQAIRQSDAAISAETDIALKGTETDTYRAHGITIVASDTDMNRQMTADTPNVLLFKAGDAESLADVLRKLNRKTGERRSPAGQYGKYITDIENLYLKLL